MNPPDLDRRRLLVAAAACAVPLLSAGAEEPKEGEDGRSADRKKFSPPDWTLLRFFGERELREVRVALASRKSEKKALEWARGGAYQGYNPGEEPLNGVVVDEKRRSFLSSCLHTLIVQAAGPGAPGGRARKSPSEMWCSYATRKGGVRASGTRSKCCSPPSGPCWIANPWQSRTSFIRGPSPRCWTTSSWRRPRPIFRRVPSAYCPAKTTSIRTSSRSSTS